MYENVSIKSETIKTYRGNDKFSQGNFGKAGVGGDATGWVDEIGSALVACVV